MRRGAPAAVVAFAAVLLLGGRNGGFLADTWGWAALPLLLLVAAVVALQRPSLTRRELALVGAFAALTAWTALSALWAPTAGPPVLEAERALLYTAAIAAVLLLGAHAAPAGVLAACVVLCAWALLGHHDTRLAGPVGYANGLGLVAVTGSLLAARRRASLVLLALLLPALVLTYSRGSWVALAAGLTVLGALRLRARPRLLAALAGVCVLAVVAFLLGAHHGTAQSSGNVSSRLMSISGNGRGDYWRAALDETRAHPVLGGGAGTWSRWWLLRRPDPNGALDAHSLYLETLAELGPLGLALLLAALALPLVALRRALREPAAPFWAAAYVALLVHAALDWDWELPGVALCGLLCGAALVAAAPGRRSRTSLVLAPAAVVGAAAVFVLQVGNAALTSASNDLDAGRNAAAAADARRAARWQPWSTQPQLLLGEARLANGDLAGAAAEFRRVLRRDPGDADAWYQLALATSGTPSARAKARAAALDPHGPVSQGP
jgi:O-antigen ligase